LIWAEGAYGAGVGWTKAVGEWILELVRKPEGSRTIQVPPRSWVVQRTFGWLNRCRRLSKNRESETESSEAMIDRAMLHLMLRRLCHS
jgi:putative transposase